MNDPNPLADESADRLVDDVNRLLERHRSEADEVEVWAQRTHRVACSLQADEAAEHTTLEVSLRTWRGGSVGVARSAGTSVDWEGLLRQALAAEVPSDLPTPGPPVGRRPEPSVFDPALPEALLGDGLLGRLAEALRENTWHEAERIPGLERLDGEVAYEARYRLVANQQGLVTEPLGELTCEVELNRCHGELVRLVHLADSFLPYAMMGARAWRTMPRGLAEPPPEDRTHGVVLHPRVLEALLRRGLPALLAEPEQGEPRFAEGELVMDQAITLVDDPGLDGLAGSRAFDDEGTPCRRSAVVIRGRMAQHLRGRRAAQRTGRPPTGCMVWRGGALQVGFSCLLMERGQPQFHDLISESSDLVVVYAIEDLQLDPATTQFQALVRWGTWLEDGHPPRALAPRRWRMRGHLLGPDGLLSHLAPCRDVLDTGTGILPYARAQARLEAVAPA